MTLLLSAGDRAAVHEFLDACGLTPGWGTARDRLEAGYRAFAPLVYENLSKIRRRAALGDGDRALLETPAVLLRGYLESGTGGTCYSLAYSLAAVLEALGLTCYLTINDLGGRPRNHAAVVAVVGETAWLCDPGVQLACAVPFSPVRESVADNGWSQVQVVPVGGGDYTVRHAMDGDAWEAFCFHSRPVPEAEFREVWLGSFGGPLMNTFHVFRHWGDHARHLCFGRRADKFPGRGRTKRLVEEVNILEEVREVWPGLPDGHAEAAWEALKGRGMSPIWAPPEVARGESPA